MRFKVNKTGKGYWNKDRTSFRVIVGEVVGNVVNALTAEGGEKFSPHDILKKGDVYYEVFFDGDNEHYFVPDKDVIWT